MCNHAELMYWCCIDVAIVGSVDLWLDFGGGAWRLGSDQSLGFEPVCVTSIDSNVSKYFVCHKH